MGVRIVSAFFLFGATMSGLTIFLLAFPATVFDQVWRINPRAQTGFSAMGSSALLLMGIVFTACCTLAVGLWRYRRWALWASITGLFINLIADLTNAIVTGDRSTLIGLPIGACFIWYLFARRRAFSAGS